MFRFAPVFSNLVNFSDKLSACFSTPSSKFQLIYLNSCLTCSAVKCVLFIMQFEVKKMFSMINLFTMQI